MPLARPREDQPHYGEHLGDPRHWGPYVRAALDRHSLPEDVIEAPFVGTFPTFIVGDVVVKLFGTSFDGQRSSRVELAMHELLAVPDFLSDAEPAGILVHGDITADHVFVDGRGITALIDWGDALVADRAYELPAVYLGAFRGDRRLLAAFLDAARWPPGDLERRGLQGILEFQFDAITTIATSYDLTQVDSLEELAGLLFATHLGDRGTGEI
jgi:hypothetical protein